MKWRNMLAMALAGVTAFCLTVPAAAATVNTAQKIELLTGAPIDKDGIQYESIGDTVTPGQTVYFLLPSNAGKMLGNSNNVRINARKSQNAKYVGNVSVLDKRLTTESGYYYVPSGFGKSDAYAETNRIVKNSRNTYIAIELKDYIGEDEIKVDLDLTFTVRKSAAAGYGFLYGTGSSNRKTGLSGNASSTNPTFISSDNFKTNGDQITLRVVLYLGNRQNTDTEITVLAGGPGQTVKPVPAEENIVYFEDASDTLATLTYQASSNPEKFYAKLSTKWTSDLLSKFKNAEAVIWRFSSATIDSSSRATLALNNPFDTDDIDPKRVWFYTVDSSGVLKDATSSFTYDSDEDTYSIRTRTIGTYIISDTKIKL